MSVTLSNVAIRPVITPQEQEWFLEVPHRVYEGNPYWVAPLKTSEVKTFAPSNPFFTYGKLERFLAMAGDRPVGRVVAAVNQRLIEREGKNLGVFGFFECIEEFEVARSLLHAACQWLKEQGMERVRGPIDLSTHKHCLFALDGFDQLPALKMPYNPPYYPEYMERDGWQKAKDAYAYELDLTKPLPDLYERGYRIACKSGITFRTIQLKGEGFDRDCRSLYHLFTKAFANNWSSSSRTEEEFLADARDLRSLAEADLFYFAEDNGEPIGFFMNLPDYNIPLKHVRGKLDLWGILKFLWYRRQIDRCRVIAICALPEYRRQMVPVALIHLGMQGATQPGKPYKRAELSWVWEDNTNSRNIIEATGCRLYKTFRVYEKQL